MVRCPRSTLITTLISDIFISRACRAANAGPRAPLGDGARFKTSVTTAGTGARTSSSRLLAIASSPCVPRPVLSAMATSAKKGMER